MKRNVLKAVCASLAAVVMVSGFWMADQNKMDTGVPQLVSYIDYPDGTITIEEEETPLAAKNKPVVKKKTTKKTTTKKIKMATKAKKSSKKTKKKTVKTSNTTTSSTKKVKTDKTVQTTEVTSLKKNSRIKTIKTTVKTTTTTTTTKITAPKNEVIKKTVAVRTIAPKAHTNVLAAYEKMGFAVKVDSTVSYSGKFDAAARNITVQKNSEDAIYHELGHFVAFVAGNVDQTAAFKAIYEKEKSKFTGTRNNDAYVKSTAAEYFAESYQDYVERPAVLKSTRPQTYKAIVDAVNQVTDARATQLMQWYANIWK